AAAGQPGADLAAAIAAAIARQAEQTREGDADRERTARRRTAPVDPLVLAAASAPLQFTEGEKAGGARSGHAAGEGEAVDGDVAPPPAPGAGPAGGAAAGVRLRERGGAIDVREGEGGRTTGRRGPSGDGRPLGP